MTEFPKQHRNRQRENSPSFELILFNDDFHNFDFIIEKLKQHCNHTAEQAEQSALIAHHKGECSILTGNTERINTARKKLEFEGLIVDSREVLA